MEFTFLCLDKEDIIQEVVENRSHMGEMVFLTPVKIRISSR